MIYDFWLMFRSSILESGKKENLRNFDDECQEKIYVIQLRLEKHLKTRSYLYW